jgi:dipeptidase E
MRIAIAGGGGREDSVRIDRYFAGWIGGEGTLLYIPVALGWPRARYADADDWIRGVFEPYGVSRIHMWMSLEHHRPDELFDFTGAYLGGGNTFRLLNLLRRTGFGAALAEFASANRPIYGGSAGAVVLGEDIATVDHLDDNAVGITETAGLGLLNGASVWVHYENDQRHRVDAYCRSHPEDLLVMTERSGIVLEADICLTVGYEPAFLVDEAGWQRLSETGHKV